MGLFSKLQNPVFLKEDSNAEKQVEKLRELYPSLNKEGQEKLEQDIRKLEYGIVGEKNIAYELKNSHMPMYILHDIFLSDGELEAQIDYLIFTKKICFVVECKNLMGNIKITNGGDFVRLLDYRDKGKSRGIYSPITQNQHHIELMKKMKKDSKRNILSKTMVNQTFDKKYKPVVVLANPQTIIDYKYAKKEIREQIVRSDRLIEYIRKSYNESNLSEMTDTQMLEWAKFYLELHTETEKDYISKYDCYRISQNEITAKQPDLSGSSSTKISEEKAFSKEDNEIEKTEIFQKLKAFRLNKSREEQIKPYYIYNDNQLKELIEKMPASLEELKKVNGFGEIKAEKYGKEILDILLQFN
ncbi:MAG: helicase [Lachnospiraceae bacterium]|nr:helicase [Lachnospiraceae bacterium]